MNALIKFLIASALIFLSILQFIEIDNFEIKVYALGLFDLNISLILTRLIISLEFLFGVLLIMNIVRTKFQFRKTKNKRILTIILILSVLSSTLILSPPDTFMKKQYAEYTTYNIEKLNNYISKNNLNEGKHILCFYGTGCQYCKLAVKKISVIVNKAEAQSKLKFIFWGTNKEVISFFNNAKLRLPEYKILAGNIFLDITDGKMPFIALLNNGEVEKKYSYRDISENEIINFLK